MSPGTGQPEHPRKFPNRSEDEVFLGEFPKGLLGDFLRIYLR
jgi:hypothetical protein